jgi:hypothetical protein
MVNAISQIPPLAEFVPLIGRINPDFIFSIASYGMPEQILIVEGQSPGHPSVDSHQHFRTLVIHQRI